MVVLKPFKSHVRKKYRGIYLAEMTNCMTGLGRHSSQGDGSNQYWWPVRMGWGTAG